MVFRYKVEKMTLYILWLLLSHFFNYIFLNATLIKTALPTDSSCSSFLYNIKHAYIEEISNLVQTFAPALS